MRYLTTVFDHKLTMQKNSAIGEKLSSMEFMTINQKVSTKKKSYVKITGDDKCGVCSGRLDLTKMYVYPNGQVVHKHCTKGDINRCPVTKQTFKYEFANV